MMRDLREKTKFIMLFVAVAFVGLMVFEWGMDISGLSVAQQTGELGRVNGEPVPFQAYSITYQQLYEQARQQSGSAQLSREQIRSIEDAAFDEVVNDILMRQELRARGIRVYDQEIVQAARWMPHPELMQNELFVTNGQFDISKYQEFLMSPAANEQLLFQLEEYYRNAIPRTKLIRQVTAGGYVGDAELWKIWRDQNETATVEYVQLNVSVLVPGDVEVTDREIRTYYDRNREQFERPSSARFAAAYLSKTPSPADSAETYRRALVLREEILAGADFAEVAMRESADPGTRTTGGELGTFGRNQMVPAFEEVAFSLPVGEVSEPVRTDFGVHLIEVQERLDDDQIRARHILLQTTLSDEMLDLLYSRADSLETLAQRVDLSRAAQAVNAALREGVVISETQTFVPGIGSALEAIEWARDEQSLEDPMDVSPIFETPEALYLVVLDSYTEPGTVPLSEASPEIRRRLILEKKTEMARQIGQQMAAEVRGGKSLAAAAGERRLSVETATGISRIGFNPAFGQANAATGAAFGVPIGQVSEVVSTPGGLFLIRPIAREEASHEEFEQQKDNMRQFAMFQVQQDAIARWLEDLRRDADIIDRRGEAMAAANAPLTPL